MNFKEICNNIKEELKILIKEELCLKSISFSNSSESKELIIYFAWNQEQYEEYFQEREILRNNIKNILKKNHFILNRSKSTSAKFIFKYIKND